jgi:SAM-dependent methyltransferase
LQLECLKNGKWVLRRSEATNKTTPQATHNREKNYRIDAGSRPYLHDLNITNVNGEVLKHAQDKYRQINHYIDLLAPHLENLKNWKALNVLDMGSGKGYLTFALYDYLHSALRIEASVTGIEHREDLVTLCNQIASKYRFTQLHFQQSYIADVQIADTQLLIALHACDTATDDAIYAGIRANVHLIVVAPCCHKQIRNEMEKAKGMVWKPILKHGIYLERTAEMLTDSLRALILEREGYKTKVIEFTDAAHTPKNVMIIAEKRDNWALADRNLISSQIDQLKHDFGISVHYLEKLLQEHATENSGSSIHTKT